MKVLYAYNQHRGGGGSDNAARATIAASRKNGLTVEVFSRSSDDLPQNVIGRLTAGASAIYAPRSVREFTAVLDSFGPDVVHVHEVFPLVSPWILPPCTRRRIPVVMTCVDYRLTCPIVTHLRGGELCTRCLGGREYRALLGNCRGNLVESATVAVYGTIARRFRLFSEHVAHFIAPSEFTRGWLIEHLGVDENDVTAVSPIVESPAEAAPSALGTYVAYAGRLTREKGVETLLEAAARCRLPFRLAYHVASARLHDVEVPSLEGVEIRVTRDREELEAFYRGARLLVMPSIWFETFGLVAAEAMSHGLPVVASRLGALACLIEDGVDGLLFEPGDPRDLADKVARLWNDAELCQRLGRTARQKATSEWTEARHFERHHAIYQRATGSSTESSRSMELIGEAG